MEETTEKSATNSIDIKHIVAGSEKQDELIESESALVGMLLGKLAEPQLTSMHDEERCEHLNSQGTGWVQVVHTHHHELKVFLRRALHDVLQDSFQFVEVQLLVAILVVEVVEAENLLPYKSP